MPSGTIVFLFTDVEGSTQRWDRYREAMQAALRRHDELVRAAIVRNGGSRLQDDRRRLLRRLSERRGSGTRSARRATRSGRGRFRGGRAGCACGWPCTRVRPTNATATISARPSTAWPGCWPWRTAARVLISTAAAQLASENLPPGARLDDLGRVRLKDLQRGRARFRARRGTASLGLPAAAFARCDAEQPSRTGRFVRRPEPGDPRDSRRALQSARRDDRRRRAASGRRSARSKLRRSRSKALPTGCGSSSSRRAMPRERFRQCSPHSASPSLRGAPESSR